MQNNSWYNAKGQKVDWGKATVTLEQLYAIIANFGYWVSYGFTEQERQEAKAICEEAYKEIRYRRMMAL